MKRSCSPVLCFVLLMSLGIRSLAAATGTQRRIESPGGVLALEAGVLADGRPFYRLWRERTPVLSTSGLGISFKNQPPLRNGLDLVGFETTSRDEEWKTVWGQHSTVRDRHRQLKITLKEEGGLGRVLVLTFRLFDDGLGLRYEIPSSDPERDYVVTDEHTEFALCGNHDCHWIYDDYNTYELCYLHTPLSRLGKERPKNKPHTFTRKQGGPRGANTPLTMRTRSGLHLAIHEAALIDYAGMTLRLQGNKQNTLVSALVPWPNGDKVRGTGTLQTPWRVVLVGDTAGKLIESTVILNLNEPCKIEDTQFIEPMKYVGIWWGMQLGIKTWGKAGGRHGATTAEAIRYIDFAADNGIPGVLVEGWNTGWEGWGKKDNFDFVTPYEDFDLATVARHARERDVALIGHHETGGQIGTYERMLSQAFELYQRHGIKAIKTGYAGDIRPVSYHRHSQPMVRHYMHVVREAARHGIMLDVHEPIKPTGIRRTYPNLMTAEGARGMEWNAWSLGNAPDHVPSLVFTRLLAGPLDYTPGIFDLQAERYPEDVGKWDHSFEEQKVGRVHSTLARQLALYVVIYSPLQMAADLIENYHGHPAFTFIREVPVDWSETRVLNGDVGKTVTVARRGRDSDDWFVGSITDEQRRAVKVSLDFLDPKRNYVATFYRDPPDGHYAKNPYPIEIERRRIAAGACVTLNMAPGGGQAISIRAVPTHHP